MSEQFKTLIQQHSNSRNNGIFPKQIDYSFKMTNPLCGDHVHLKISLAQDTIEQVGFHTESCLLCNASTSFMSEILKEKEPSEAIRMSEIFEQAFVKDSCSSEWPIEIEELIQFSDINILPNRKMCILLPWITLRKALKV